MGASQPNRPQALKSWRAEFPDAQLEHYVFPSESTASSARRGLLVARLRRTRRFRINLSGPGKQPGGKPRSRQRQARWHDLRHTAVRRVAAGGATDGTLQAIFGWLSPGDDRAICHVRIQAKRKAVSVLDGPKTQKPSPQKSPTEGAVPTEAF